MTDLVAELDRQFLGNFCELFVSKGHVSHKLAVEKAQAEFEIYRAKEMK